MSIYICAYIQLQSYTKQKNEPQKSQTYKGNKNKHMCITISYTKKIHKNVLVNYAYTIIQRLITYIQLIMYTNIDSNKQTNVCEFVNYVTNGC